MQVRAPNDPNARVNFIAELEELPIESMVPSAKVVINARTGSVVLNQAVTLGAKRFATDADGHLAKGGARHPILEDEVVIYAGATILGRVTIGRGSTIGGNVWLTHSVPPGSRITQAHPTSTGPGVA